MSVIFEKANGEQVPLETIVNRQTRFYIEETPHEGYWIWEGDSFERTLVKRCDTLEETHRWIVDKLAG